MKKQALIATLLLVGTYATNYNMEMRPLTLKVRNISTTPEKTFDLTLSRDATRMDLRRAIKKATGIPMKQQVLKFVTIDGGKLLQSWEDNDKLIIRIRLINTGGSYFELERGYTQHRARKRILEVTEIVKDLGEMPYLSDEFVPRLRELQKLIENLLKGTQWVEKTLLTE